MWHISIAVGCGACYGSKLRRDLRYKYNIQEGPCSDCCVHFLCPCFAICQEARELKYRAKMAAAAARAHRGAYQPPVRRDRGTH
eukprot:g6977.t1